MVELVHLDGEAIRARLGPRTAVDALEAALRGGVDPGAAIPRSILPLTGGELLLMPAEVPAAVGVKVLTVGADDARRGLPRIQGLYLLFDPTTLQPRAVLDGIELTALRTPAVSLLAVRSRLRSGTAPLRVVVAGTGLQAVRHVETTAEVVSDVRQLGSVTYLSRRPRDASMPTIAGVTPQVVEHRTESGHAALATADLIVCATSATDPLFDSAPLRDDVTVIAVGSHDPDRRELDAHLMGRSTVVVEDVATALREAGDVVQAVQAGLLDPATLVPLTRAVLEPGALPPDRPLVFKSTGMAWQDAVVAAAVMSAGDRP